VRDSGTERLSDAEFLAAIEANAETLLRERKSLPAEQLENFRATHPRVRMLPTLTLDSFGTAGKLQPMQEINTTRRRLYLP
jgi:hypothetical protein